MHLAFDHKLLRVAGQFELGIGQFVYLSGSMAFEKGASGKVTLRDGAATTEREVSLVTLGAKQVRLVAGVGGPYWTDADGQDDVDASELNPGAKGLWVEGVEFGLGLMQPTPQTRTQNNVNTTGGTPAVAAGLDVLNSDVVSVTLTATNQTLALVENTHYTLNRTTDQITVLTNALPAAYKVSAATVELTVTNPSTYRAATSRAGTVAIVGLNDLTVQATNLRLEFNGSDDGNCVVDFTMVPADPLDTDIPAGLRVSTGPQPADEVHLAFDHKLFRIEADVNLAVSDFFYLSGTVSFEKREETVMLTANGVNTGSQTVELMTLAGEDLDVIVGINGPYDALMPNNTPGALGLSVTDVDFALALARPKVPTPEDQRSWYALKAEQRATGAVNLVGISGLTAQVSQLPVEINKGAGRDINGANQTVVDWPLSFPDSNTSDDPDGLEVSLPTQIIELDSAREVLQARGRVHLAIEGFLYVDGFLAFRKGDEGYVRLSDGTDQKVRALTVSGDNLNVFLGINGPY